MLIALFSLLGIVLALVLLQLSAFWSLRFALKPIQVCTAQELPEHVRTLFAPPHEMLLSFGFEWDHAEKCLMQINGRDIEMWSQVFFHPRYQTYAHLSTTMISKNRTGYDITFESIFDSNDFVYTTNNYKHYMTPSFAPIYVEDIYSDRWEEVFAHHVRSINRHEEMPLYFAPEYYVEHALEVYRHRMFQATQCGELRLNADDTLSYTFTGAIRAWARALIGERRAKRPKAATPAQPDAQEIERELSMYRQIKASAQSSLSRWKKFALFALSLVLFALAFGLTLSWQTALLIIGVLLLHEGGHLLAMYLLGYKELSVLFLPFVGAVAISKKPQYNSYKRFIVSLSGPLPGIVLGLYLLLGMRSDAAPWVRELTYLLLFLNIFNLLPIMPLDGGQIVHHLLFYRHPLFQIAFMALSALAALALALLFGGTTWILALIVAAVAFFSSSDALVRRDFLSFEKPSNDEEYYLRRIFRFLQQPKYRHYASSKKYLIAEHLLAYRMTRKIHAASVLLLLGIYTATLIVPPVLIIAHQAKEIAHAQEEAAQD